MSRRGIFQAVCLLKLSVACALAAAAPPPTSLHDGIRETVSLDGVWHVRYDEDDALKAELVEGASFAEALQPHGPAGPAQVLLPSTIEHHRPGYDGVVWYWRDFVVPNSWQGSYVVLEFDAIDYACEVYINGRRRGRITNSGGYHPFSVDITAQARFGESNRVMVRVDDLPLQHRPSPIGAERYREADIDSVPHGLQTSHGNFGGIWQSVRMVRVHPLYCVDLHAVPGADSRETEVYFTYRVPAEWQGPVEAVFALSPADAPDRVLSQGRIELKVDRGGVYPSKYTLHHSPLARWSSRDPNLYIVTLTLRDEELVYDQLQRRFGARTIGFDGERLTWNGEPLSLHAAVYLPAFGVSLAPTHSPDEFRREIRQAKEAGLNTFLTRASPLPAALMDVADEEGFLLLVEPPTSDMQPSRTAEAQALLAMTTLAMHERSRPSLLGWARVMGDRAVDGDRDRQLFIAQLRRIDRQRPIFNASLLSPGVYDWYLPDSTAPSTLHVVRAECETAFGGGADEVLTLAYVAGHAGCWDTAATLDHYDRRRRELQEPEAALRRIAQQGLEAYQSLPLDDRFPSLSAWLNLSAETQAELLSRRVLAARGLCAAGFVLEQWNDLSWDQRGLVTPFRRAKPAYHAVAAAAHTLACRVHTIPAIAAPGEPIQYCFETYNAGPARPAMVSLEARVRDAQGRLSERPFYAATHRLEVSAGHETAFTAALPLQGEVGAVSITASLAWDQQIVATTHETPIVSPRRGSGTLIAISGEVGLSSLLERLGYTVVPGPPEHDQRSVVIVGPCGSEDDGFPYTALPGVYDRVHCGDTAVFFGAPLLWRRHAGGWTLAFPEAFPFAVHAFGVHQDGVTATHFARAHPVTRALTMPLSAPASSQLQPQLLLTVRDASTETCVFLPGETIVGWYAPVRGSSRVWTEVGHVWRGSDLVITPYGEGKLILCQLPLLERAADHPLAARLLVDLLEHAREITSGTLEAVAPERADRRYLEDNAFAAYFSRSM